MRSPGLHPCTAKPLRASYVDAGADRSIDLALHCSTEWFFPLRERDIDIYASRRLGLQRLLSPIISAIVARDSSRCREHHGVPTAQGWHPRARHHQQERRPPVPDFVSKCGRRLVVLTSTSRTAPRRRSFFERCRLVPRSCSNDPSTPGSRRGVLPSPSLHLGEFHGSSNC